jgi:hypothetical protein
MDHNISSGKLLALINRTGNSGERQTFVNKFHLFHYCRFSGLASAQQEHFDLMPKYKRREVALNLMLS